MSKFYLFASIVNFISMLVSIVANIPLPAIIAGFYSIVWMAVYFMMRRMENE